VDPTGLFFICDLDIELWIHGDHFLVHCRNFPAKCQVLYCEHLLGDLVDFDVHHCEGKLDFALVVEALIIINSSYRTWRL
jgi:hypothetical protein